MVAPIRVTSPDSTDGRKTSCDAEQPARRGEEQPAYAYEHLRNPNEQRVGNRQAGPGGGLSL